MDLPDLDPTLERGVEDLPVDEEDESRASISGFQYKGFRLVLVLGESRGGSVRIRGKSERGWF